jgi:steroid delta-isomerase-like uncharacterized protein
MTDLHRRFSDAINRHDADDFVALYAENAVVHDPSYPQPLRGRDEIRRDIETMFRGFPDLRSSVNSHVDSEGMIAFEGTFEGTHDGPLAVGDTEIPPTGRTVRFTGAGFYRLDDGGRVVEERRHYDLAGIPTQVGADASTAR